MQKIINSNTAKYQPMLTDNLVLDDKPTVNSFNSVTSDGVARAIAGASGEVPAVTEADNGKVLTAVYDEGGAAVEWAEAQGGGEYSAGTGISISAQDEISVDTTVIATKNDLNGYQPAISDLETIRSGASAGATAVQPSQLASVATSGSYADLSNKPTIPTVDQSYSASSTNAQSGTAVAGALATVNQVPASTSADKNKVLTVNSSGNAVWATAQGGGSSITIGTAPDGWQTLTTVCGYAPQGPMESVFGFQGSALTTAGNVLFDSTNSGYGFVTPNYQSGYQDMPVYVVLFYPYSYNNTSFNDFVIGPSIGSYYSPYQVHSYNSAITFTDEMKAFIASRQYPGSVGIGLYAGDRSETTLTKDNLCKFVKSSDPSTIANDASWVKVAGEYVNKINGMPVGSPTFSTSSDAGKVLTVGSSGLEWINSVPIEVVASMPASPTSGVLYIVTGA